MPDVLTLETSLWELVARGTAMYLGTAVIVRLIPKRQTGSLSPNDLIALIVVGSLAADGIIGDTKGAIDILVMIAVVLLWDYLFNVLEYHVPRFRRIAQDSPTLLIYDGRLLERNLRKEQLTEQELKAELRKQGVEELGRVKQAILEADGHISVIENREQ